MDEPSWEIRPELKEWVENMKNSDEKYTIVLRGLYRLYFDTKPVASRAEKGHLLSEGWGFGVKSGVPPEIDKQIFKEEAKRFYGKEPQAQESPGP